MDWWEDDIYDQDDDRIQFADPGGKSALRAGKRDQPCPTCGWPDRLTKEDVAIGYQCDSCADAMEGNGEIDYYEEVEQFMDKEELEDG